MSTNRNPSSVQTRNMTLGAMFAALAFVSTVLIHLNFMPGAQFLTYDPKDIVIALGGLILSPVYAVMIAVVTALIEWFTISDTGIIGFLMNSLSSVSFALVASVVYHRRKNLQMAVVGLAAGCLSMVVVMLLWNYIVTPLYMNVSRDVVVSMLLPIFLPFNLLKGGLNAALTFLLYRPVIGVLRNAHLLPASDSNVKKRNNWPVLIGAAVVVLTCVLVILSMNKMI